MERFRDRNCNTRLQLCSFPPTETNSYSACKWHRTESHKEKKEVTNCCIKRDNTNGKTSRLIISQIRKWVWEGGWAEICSMQMRWCWSWDALQVLGLCVQVVVLCPLLQNKAFPWEKGNSLAVLLALLLISALQTSFDEKKHFAPRLASSYKAYH